VLRDLFPPAPALLALVLPALVLRGLYPPASFAPALVLRDLFRPAVVLLALVLPAPDLAQALALAKAQALVVS
jgi:hypothetical protein